MSLPFLYTFQMRRKLKAADEKKEMRKKGPLTRQKKTKAQENFIEVEIPVSQNDKEYDLQVIDKFRGLCRMCGNSNAMIPIFNNEQHPDLVEDLKRYTEVELCDGDGLPNRICSKCCNQIESLKSFIKIAQEQDKNFKMAKIRHEANIEKTKGEPAVQQLPGYQPTASCMKCGKEFTSRVRLKHHIMYCLKPADPVGSYLCDICGKEFKKKIVYRRHILQHNKMFPFKCDQCPYRGQFKDLLKIHQKTHLTVKPHKCTYCDKTFATSSNLSKHIRTHLTVRMFKCEICEKTFKQKVDLKRHTDSMHGMKPKIHCEVCGNAYTKTYSLYKHLRKVHDIIRTGRHGRLPAYLMAEQQQPVNPESNGQEETKEDEYCLVQIEDNVSYEHEIKMDVHLNCADGLPKYEPKMSRDDFNHI